MKYGFVILHYLTADDTINCVNSIFCKCKGNYEIVIVDNFSNNGSIEKVEKNIKNKIVHIIKNNENLGFAKGNNIGYKYCKDKLKCDTIIILNNDILIESDNIFECIEKDLKKFNCDVIGPDIVSLKDGGHQNPMTENIKNKKDIYFDIIKYKFLYFLSYIYLYEFFKRLKKNKKNVISGKKNNSSFLQNVLLHGSFLIFTPHFVKNMDNAFCNDTFLYMEEIILKKICEKNNYKTLYDPNIKIYHKEDSSTNKFNDNDNRKKRMFVFKNLVKSYYVLLKVINEKL